jgi:hypothetical protein
VHAALVPLSIEDIPNGGCERFLVFVLIGLFCCSLGGDGDKLLIEGVEYSCGCCCPMRESMIFFQDEEHRDTPILEGVEHGLDLPRLEIAADGVLDFELAVFLVQFTFQDVEVYRIDDEVL